MKRIILEVCFVVNLLFCLALVYVLVATLLGSDLYTFFQSEQGVNLRMFINIPIIILWIFNFIMWSKHDKNILQFVLILLLNALYNPFYFRKAVKNKWV